MGELISFPVDKVQHKTNSEKHGRETAVVLVFEGVRYFRDDRNNDGVPLKASSAKPLS